MPDGGKVVSLGKSRLMNLTLLFRPEIGHIPVSFAVVTFMAQDLRAVGCRLDIELRAVAP